MKLSEKRRQELLANGNAYSHGGRLFIAIDQLSDGSGLAVDEEKVSTAPEPKAKADGSK
jgi:hypothetical protein